MINTQLISIMAAIAVCTLALLTVPVHAGYGDQVPYKRSEHTSTYYNPLEDKTTAKTKAEKRSYPSAAQYPVQQYGYYPVPPTPYYPQPPPSYRRVVQYTPVYHYRYIPTVPAYSDPQMYQYPQQAYGYDQQYGYQQPANPAPSYPEPQPSYTQQPAYQPAYQSRLSYMQRQFRQ